MTTSAIFLAAHAAAKVASAVVAYKVRFSTALRSAWAAAKQTVNTITTAIMETISNPNFSADLANPVTANYDILHTAGNAAFVVRRIEGRKDVVMVATTRSAIAGGAKLFVRNGETFFHFAHISQFGQLDAADLSDLNITAADVAAATTTLNA
ncbi:hypothetical protein [Hymenobacter psychrophilus]|uniref:Uncharacterized protein n=1 Tax=Hymenobacter psychrophilus TaxID=651662 RepID=A0A1H3PJF8_9BACT|nr:hypothetical protein [Hymenobacter psychrophilus]SDZ01211.1 hypothetical protein SAMN04488069_1356 [Hymenobacter psychrophilus]